MMLGLIFVGMTIAVLALLLFPLLRAQGASALRVDYDIAIYRDQLAEVDRDIERGLLTSPQAEAARGEIQRRVLAAADAEKPVAEGVRSLRQKLVPVFVLLIAVPLCAGLTYAYLGSPELPARPYAARQSEPEFVLTAEAAKLSAALAAKPEAEGYKHLAEIYFVLHRYDQTAMAYQKVIQLGGGNAGLWSGLGEAIALSNETMVTPEARQAFVKALRLDPHDARARFYLGLEEAQKGDLRRAVAIWRDLEKDSPVDAPWLEMLRARIAAVAKDGGFDPSSVLSTPPSLSVTHDDAAAIMGMNPKDQNAMIHKMVDRLAAKMKNNPDNLDGWLRLAKAYRVLGETDKAKEAEAKAAALKAKSP